MIDERRKFQLLVGVAATVVVIGVMFAIGLAADDEADNPWAILTAVIVVAIAVMAAFVARKRRKEMRQGIPSEDERSTALKMRAGYLSFFVSMYLCLALGWIFGVLLEDTTTKVPSTGTVMFIMVAAMGVIYGIVWIGVSRGTGMP
jgi:membrane protein DedA with SNARE-associated domain